MKIREYKKGDEVKIKKLILSVLASIFEETKVKWEDFECYDVFYVVEEEEKIIGTVALKKLGKDLVKLKRMYVNVGWQGKGIGNKLLEKAIEFARKRGSKKMILTTYPEMKNAVKFYKKRGFEIVKNPSRIFFTNPFLKEYNQRQIAMEKELK